MFIDWLALGSPLVLVFLLAMPTYLIMAAVNKIDTEQRKKPLCALVIVGIFAFIFGAFPYWVLGHVPAFTGWYSRHQLLLPVGTSLLLVALSNRITGKMRLLVISMMISAFISINVKTYWNFYFDWHKQTNLVELIRLDKDIENADLIIFQDNAYNLNAISRPYSTYEWNGFLYQAFGDEKRMGINFQDYEKFVNGQLFKGFFTEGEKYRAAEFTQDSAMRTKFVQISPDRHRIRYLMNESRLINMKVYDWSDTRWKNAEQ